MPQIVPGRRRQDLEAGWNAEAGCRIMEAKSWWAVDKKTRNDDIYLELESNNYSSLIHSFYLIAFRGDEGLNNDSK